MTINKNINSSKEVQSPMLLKLRDLLQAASIAYPSDQQHLWNVSYSIETQKTVEAQKTLAVRAWKSSLNTLPVWDIVDLLKEINTSNNPYITKTLKPVLLESLQTENIVSILTIMLNAYSKNTFWQTKLLLMDKKNRNDFFKDKKDAIKEVLTDKYQKGELDGKLIFWLWLLLSEGKSSASGELKTFVGWTFWEDIQKWLFSGARVHTSFWNSIAEKSQETPNIKENINKNIYDNLAEKI